MGRVLMARSSCTTAREGRSSPGGQLGVIALALFVAGCGQRDEMKRHDGIVVVRSAADWRPPAPAVTPSETPHASIAGGLWEAAAMASEEAGLVQNDAEQAIELTAIREADPYRLGGVDPQVLAEARAAE
jgi:hypothetical protein